MAATLTPRSSDLKHLDMLARFQAGETQASIAERHGTSRAAVAVIIQRVIKADLEESGERTEAVLAG